jgi:NADPH-dependent glutamate synthase beta subunit-like oxidoreductase
MPIDTRCVATTRPARAQRITSKCAIMPAAWCSGRMAAGAAPDAAEASVPGVFAVGDVRHGSVKRVAAAVGEGSVAICSVHQYLAEVGARVARRA